MIELVLSSLIVLLLALVVSGRSAWKEYEALTVAGNSNSLFVDVVLVVMVGRKECDDPLVGQPLPCDDNGEKEARFLLCDGPQRSRDLVVETRRRLARLYSLMAATVVTSAAVAESLPSTGTARFR